MKSIRLTLVTLTMALLSAGAYQTLAFHSGGVAECVGCHSMHSAQSGALLTMNDVSSTCLNCHESATGSSYHVSTAESAMPAGTPPANQTPGGDFGWLKKDFAYIPRGTAVVTEDGEHHGHNIVATDFNYMPDSRNATAPGGTFDSTTLACNSCHDQHGTLRRLSDGTIANTGAPIMASGSYNTSPVPAAGQAVGVYRLLRGLGSPAIAGVTYANTPPAAVAPSSYNRSEAATDTRVAYGAGMSDFCASCHTDMHQGSGNLTHLVDTTLSAGRVANYNAYVGSGDLTGDVSTAYDSLVPLQTDNSTDYAALALLANNNGSDTSGASATDRVMCLSCHRAHASGWEYATRWDNEIELIIVDGEWPGTDAVSPDAALGKWAKGRTVAERARAHNDTPATDYASYQRVLCNKCHAKD